MEKQGIGLKHLKEEYEKLQKKYKLPSFKKLNEDFWIEKAAESETEILIREIRKFVGDKIFNYMRFIEGLLNPVNVPIFVFSFIKLMEPDDKKRISEIYKELTKMELKFIEADLKFSEEKEAKLIKDSYDLWQTIKEDMLEITEKINKKWDSKSESNTKGYFG